MGDLHTTKDIIVSYRIMQDKVRNSIIEDFKRFFIYHDESVKLKQEVRLRTWNRGFDFIVHEIKKRKDGSIMIVGDYHYRKDDDEFLSYVCDVDDLIELYNEFCSSVNIN